MRSYYKSVEIFQKCTLILLLNLYFFLSFIILFIYNPLSSNLWVYLTFEFFVLAAQFFGLFVQVFIQPDQANLSDLIRQLTAYVKTTIIDESQLQVNKQYDPMRNSWQLSAVTQSAHDRSHSWKCGHFLTTVMSNIHNQDLFLISIKVLTWTFPNVGKFIHWNEKNFISKSQYNQYNHMLNKCNPSTSTYPLLM